MDSIDSQHRTMWDEWCSRCESRPVSQLCDTTSSYLKFQKHLGKPWFQKPHHATTKKNTWLFVFQLEIHRFHWSQASHHVKRMMQPARIKTAKTIAIHWLHFRYTESGKETSVLCILLRRVCSRGAKTVVRPYCFNLRAESGKKTTCFFVYFL